MTRAILGSRFHRTEPEVNFISSINDKIRADLPLPDEPIMTVRLPVSIVKSMPDKTLMEVGQENAAFLISKANVAFFVSLEYIAVFASLANVTFFASLANVRLL